jgi:hypothetical protein
MSYYSTMNMFENIIKDGKLVKAIVEGKMVLGSPTRDDRHN